MTPVDSPATPMVPPPTLIERWLPVPPPLVFRAWTTAAHLQRWFSPAGYTVPTAEVAFHPGGSLAVCMRAPDGQEFWSRGQFGEIVPDQHLSFATSMAAGDRPGFTAHTRVGFAAQGPGTRLSVRQDYAVFEPALMRAVDGAPEGWRTTLDKLAVEVAAIAGAEPASHGMFTLQRQLPAPPATVFAAFVDPALKARWFHGGAAFTELERVMDVRPGGRERARGQWPGGMESCFDAVYFEVLPGRRLVYAYEMQLNALRISVSLATLTFDADGAGTRLTVTEQGTFLNGYADAGAREHGSNDLLDRLAAALSA